VIHVAAPLEGPGPEEESSARTTDEERDGYNIVRAILSEVVDARRVALRDQQSYCGVLLDDNNRKPICRLWFNTSRKYLGLFDESKSERRVLLTDLAEIFQHAATLKQTAQRYLEAR
jgi:predicted type IV restriction endonuclease